MAFGPSNSLDQFHTEDHQVFRSSNGSWKKTAYSKGFSSNAGEWVPVVTSTKLPYPAAERIRSTISFDTAVKGNVTVRFKAENGAYLVLDANTMPQRWGQFSWFNGGQVELLWENQLALDQGIVVNGTRGGAQCKNGEPQTVKLDFMKVASTTTILRMETLYHADASIQRVNAVFYLSIAIEMFRYIEIANNTNGNILATIANEWW